MFLISGKQTVRRVDNTAGLGYQKKRMLLGNQGDTGLNVTRLRKQAHVWLVFLCEKRCRTTIMEKKQMTEMIVSLPGAAPADKETWDSINWYQVTSSVQRLQMRIAKAVREKRYGKVKALQWLLTHSFAAKLLAVKRVTQNPGSKSPGVDGVLWRTPKQKMCAVETLRRRGYQTQPLRRLYISKPQGGKRPLSIPTVKDRSMQALHLLALEPVAEMVADKNAYGFRPKRSTADAIAQVYLALARKVSAPWILEGDIRACFDKLSADWILSHIPMDKAMLSKWLKAGYIEKGTLHPTLEGVPQGGIISPTILVIALSGLEETIKRAVSIKDKVNVVIYADDFIVTGASPEVLEQKVMPTIRAFLKERGLDLSPHKTKITHIRTGFDFLGFNIRKYKDKLLTKPSKANVHGFLREIRGCIKSKATAKTENLLWLLNPKIRGWANYFRNSAAKRTFNYVDHHIFQALRRWISRRHPTKSARWKHNKYFRSEGLRHWIFSAAARDKQGIRVFVDLFRAAQVPIRRHVKIRGDATPYDPQFRDYFLQRERMKKKSCGKDREA